MKRVEQTKKVQQNRARYDKYISKDANRIKNLARTMARYHYPVAEECAVTTCKKIGERHHPDITKPLEIVWLCHKHHILMHDDITKRRVCSFGKCKNKHAAQGYCIKHYRTLVNKGILKTPKNSMK